MTSKSLRPSKHLNDVREILVTNLISKLMNIDAQTVIATINSLEVLYDCPNRHV